MNRTQITESRRRHLTGEAREAFAALLADAANARGVDERANIHIRAFRLLGESWFVYRDDPAPHFHLFAAWAGKLTGSDRQGKFNVARGDFWPAPPPPAAKPPPAVPLDQAPPRLRDRIAALLEAKEYRQVLSLASQGVTYLRPSDDEGFTAWVATELQTAPPCLRPNLDSEGRTVRAFAFNLPAHLR